MMRRLLRNCLAEACRASTLLTFAERRTRGRLVILCYHRVLPPADKASCPMPALVVTPDSFRRQCLTLQQHYDVRPVHEAVAALCEGRTVDRPLGAVTFDDGYRDNYRYAAPILRDTGIKATFFVIAELVGTERAPWYDRISRSICSFEQQGTLPDRLAELGMASALGELDETDANAPPSRRVVALAKRLSSIKRRELVERLCEERYLGDHGSRDDLIMDWSQLAELADFGHEIGSHSLTHEMLPQLDDASLTSEVVDSRRALENGLGQQVRSFCYPDGEVDERVARAVESAGYTCAVTVRTGSNGPDSDVYHLRRWFIHENLLCGFRRKTSETLLRMELSQLADYVFARRRRRTDNL